MTYKVIRTRLEAEQHNVNEPALVEIPGELAKSVLFLMKSLGAVSNTRRRKMAEALLSTAMQIR
jgi:hypothetical protein